MMFGRSLGEVDQPCIQTIIGLTLALIWGSGFGLISDPVWRRFPDSFWSSFGASKVSRKVAKRYTLRSKKEAASVFRILMNVAGRWGQPEQSRTECKKILPPTWKASVALLSGFFVFKWKERVMVMVMVMGSEAWLGMSHHYD